MNSVEKVNQLRCIISEKLSSLINADYILLDLPYYSNVGDVLIWQGTLDFLKTLPYKCLESKSYYTDHFEDISEDVIILLQGGGNWGDLWREHQEYRMKVIERYPKNRIIVLPQSINYDNKDLLIKDADRLSKHTKLTICTRDNHSHNLALCNFDNNNVLLVPDMAFAIDSSRFRALPNNYRSLLVSRDDLESNSALLNFQINEPFDIADWPSMISPSVYSNILSKLRATSSKVPIKRFQIQLDRLSDYLADKYYRQHILNSGMFFLSPYNKIYTTRLHAAILSIHYNKDIVFIDNSYGKNSRFFDTWLNDLDNIKMIR